MKSQNRLAREDCFLYQNKIIYSDFFTGTSKTEEITINQGVRQGCSMSPTLFNIYIDDLIRNWKNEVNEGIQLTRNYHLNVMLYADDVILIQNKESDLQMSVYRLHELGRQHYNLKISVNKTKVMAHYGKYPVQSKIVIENKTLEQVSHFNYLGCEISLNEDKDIQNKTNKFQYICGTIQRTLKNKARKDTKLKFYKTMAVPVLLYGSETWIEKKERYEKYTVSRNEIFKKCERLLKKRSCKE